MSEEFLFISDLHLSPERPIITKRFIHFLQTRAPLSTRLYILGDLFDNWIGDDNPEPPNGEVIDALKQLSNRGTKLFLQHGNRDFMIGQRFAKATGLSLMDDYTVIDLFGANTLLMHGDLLCTNDTSYLEYRTKTHNQNFQQKILQLPLFLRRALVKWIKIRSHFQKKNKASKIMDVNQKTVIETMKKHSACYLIHGHTHRFNVHKFTIDGKSSQRIVLEEWDHRGSILCWNQDGYSFEPIQT